MNKQELIDAAAAHFKSGGRLVPHELQALDACILKAAKRSDRPAKAYAQMRGIFNRAFMALEVAKQFPDSNRGVSEDRVATDHESAQTMAHSGSAAGVSSHPVQA